MIDINGKKHKQTKKLGISLGGGGARGMAHIGLLKVLERENIKVSCVTGTSMGAVIGSAFALGLPIDNIEKSSLSFSKKKLLTLRNINLLHGSIVNPRIIEMALKILIGNKTFDDCKIPFEAVAVDVESGELVTLNEGKLIPALMATTALPSIFPSVLVDGRILVDGGVLENVPVLPLKKYKPDVVLGVSIANFGVRQNFSGILFRKYYGGKFKKLLRPFSFFRRFRDNLHLLTDTFLRSLDIASKDSDEMRVKKAHPDIMIYPDVEYGLFEFDKTEDIVKIGEDSLEKILPSLKQLVTS